MFQSVKKVVEYWMFYGDATIYFHGMKPPVIESQYDGNEFTALPIYNSVYVPKKAKKNIHLMGKRQRQFDEWHDFSYVLTKCNSFLIDFI